MNVPDQVREQLRETLWELADQIGWMTLPTSRKTKYYQDWARDPKIGGVLTRYIDTARIRQYFKDTLLKDYVRHRLSDESRPFRVLRLQSDTQTAARYIKPHGRRLADGRVICWGPADSWKLVLMAVFERAHECEGAKPFAAILMHPTGRYHEEAVRKMIMEAANKLGVEKLVWLDT